MQHTLRVLKLDCLLVSILSAVVTSREDRMTSGFRELRQRGGSIELNPDKPFHISGGPAFAR